MSNLNKMSVVTIIAAIGNILVVVYMSTYETSYISAILAPEIAQRCESAANYLTDVEKGSK